MPKNAISVLLFSLAWLSLRQENGSMQLSVQLLKEYCQPKFKGTPENARNEHQNFANLERW
jgi:hypothetical protein